MHEVSTDKPEQLNRLFYDHDLVRIRDVARDFKQSESGTSSKGDREMSVCEMQRRLWQAEGTYQAARREYDEVRKPTASREAMLSIGLGGPGVAEPRGIGVGVLPAA